MSLLEAHNTQENIMYNIFYKSADAADGPLHKATLPTMEAAREMHSKLLEAGWEVLTEWPH